MRDAQDSLFHESLADALGSAIAASGGFKRVAREAGSHVVMTYLANELGYAEPQPMTPRDELAEREARIEAKVDELMRELGGLKRSRLRAAGT